MTKVPVKIKKGRIDTMVNDFIGKSEEFNLSASFLQFNTVTTANTKKQHLSDKQVMICLQGGSD